MFLKLLTTAKESIGSVCVGSCLCVLGGGGGGRLAGSLAGWVGGEWCGGLLTCGALVCTLNPCSTYVFTYPCVMSLKGLFSTHFPERGGVLADDP